jgi:putative transposase
VKKHKGALLCALTQAIHTNPMTKYDPDIHHRRSIRLAGYDYSQQGCYFITICTKNREHLFGRIAGSEIQLNGFGEIVRDEWVRTSQIRPNIKLGVFAIMPNHFHGIIHIVEQPAVRAYCTTPLQQKTKPSLQSPSKTVGAIIRGFKSSVTKRINIMRDTPGLPVWHRNYYEHIIRDQDDYNRIHEYIQYNLLKWEEDDYYSKQNTSV